MKKAARADILAVAPYKPGRPIAEVKRELGLRQVFKLASNESPYGPSPKVLAAITRAAGQLNRYPDDSCHDLRQALAARLGCASDQLIFGNGSDEVIGGAVRAFVGRGDEVVVSEPCFMMYKIATQVAGGVVRPVPVQDFRYDLAGMRRVVGARTKVIFIANPDNPCGSYVSAEQLAAFLEQIPTRVVVFLDEAYFEYVHRPDYPDTLGLLPRYPNLIISRTFSKMYGLAGLRIGYGIAQPEVVDILNRVRDPFNVNALAQAAALACLKDQAYYRRIAREIDQQRAYLYQGLAALGLRYVESFTNFILVDVDGPSQPVVQDLLAKGIIVRDMTGWGLPNFFRVTIGLPEENKRFIKALRGIIS